MGGFDLHIHTEFCDGKGTPEAYARAALEKGLDSIGFSAHSPLWFGRRWCMARKKVGTYQKAIEDLKKSYAGRLRILCGVEQDYYSRTPVKGYDYVIGSVHYVKKYGIPLSVDASPKSFARIVRWGFHGDAYAFAERYYQTLADVVNRTHADIIGHFDLIKKFNAGNRFFDENHPRYIAAWQKAADALLQSGAFFEINTGAISRGYRVDAYPSPAIRDYLRARGACFLLSSDSHRPENLCTAFEIYAAEAERDMPIFAGHKE